MVRRIVLVAAVVMSALPGCRPKSVVNSPVPNPPAAQRDALAGLDVSVLEKCKKATVLIGCFQDGRLSASGSGFVIGDGRSVVTNNHVVTSAAGDVLPCKLVFFAGTDTPKLVTVQPSDISTFDNERRTDKDYFDRDVAVIHIPKKLTEPLTLADSESIHETDSVWALGFPAGPMLSFDGTELPGPTVHSVKVERLDVKDDHVRAVQLGGTPTHGDSGGPVVMAQGSVIGVLESRLQDSSIAFAVPTSKVNDLLKGGSVARNVAEEWSKPLGKIPALTTPPNHAGGVTPPTGVAEQALRTRRLSEADLSGLTAQQLTLMRNLPYAERGYAFHRPELRSFYKHFDWYHPVEPSASRIEANLSPIERYNIELIQHFQATHGLNW